MGFLDDLKKLTRPYNEDDEDDFDGYDDYEDEEIRLVRRKFLCEVAN